MIPYFKINPEWKMEVAFRHDDLAFTAQFLFPVLPEDRYHEIVHETPDLPHKMMSFWTDMGKKKNKPAQYRRLMLIADKSVSYSSLI